MENVYFVLNGSRYDLHMVRADTIAILTLLASLKSRLICPSCPGKEAFKRVSILHTGQYVNWHHLLRGD